MVVCLVKLFFKRKSFLFFKKENFNPCKKSGRRHFSSGPSGLSEEQAEEFFRNVTKNWQRYSKIGGLLIFGPFAIFCYLTDEHQHRDEIKYPHLRIRSKPFPWGDANLLGEDLQ